MTKFGLEITIKLYPKPKLIEFTDFLTYVKGLTNRENTILEKGIGTFRQN